MPTKLSNPPTLQTLLRVGGYEVGGLVLDMENENVKLEGLEMALKEKSKPGTQFVRSDPFPDVTWASLDSRCMRCRVTVHARNVLELWAEEQAHLKTCPKGKP